jgi:hypothetical protein
MYEWNVDPYIYIYVYLYRVVSEALSTLIHLKPYEDIAWTSLLSIPSLPLGQSILSHHQKRQCFK